MKRFFLPPCAVSILLLGQIAASAAPKEKPTPTASAADRGEWLTPTPYYPGKARINREQGDGFVRVITDSSDRVVRAIIVKSTGSGVLDANTISFAEAKWHGPPKATMIVPVFYRLQAGYRKTWRTPAPPIPANAPRDQPQRRADVLVTTDDAGHVAKAKIARSTGSDILDEGALKMAKTYWSGPPNSTATVPVTYALNGKTGPEKSSR